MTVARNMNGPGGLQAVILAGGLGTRLWPLTRAVPKPMVPVAGVPYLEHQLRRLAEQEIRQIVLLTGYLGEQIEEYFGEGDAWGLAIRYSREPQPLGTGGALRQARELLADDFLLIYGDSYLPIDYAAVLACLRDRGAEGVMVAYDNRQADSGVMNNVAIDADDFVVRYDKQRRAAAELTHVEAGVLGFRREVTERLPRAERVSLEEEIFPQLIRQRQLVAFHTTQRFYDIGTFDRLSTIAGVLK